MQRVPYETRAYGGHDRFNSDLSLASSKFGKVIEKKLKLELIANYIPPPESGQRELKEASIAMTKQSSICGLEESVDTIKDLPESNGHFDITSRSGGHMPHTASKSNR